MGAKLRKILGVEYIVFVIFSYFFVTKHHGSLAHAGVYGYLCSVNKSTPYYII